MNKTEQMKKTLSSNLRYLAEIQDKRQLDLAKELGYDRRRISNYFCGRSLPSVRVIRQIADFFNVSVEALLSSELELLADEEAILSMYRKLDQADKQTISRLMSSLLSDSKYN